MSDEARGRLLRRIVDAGLALPEAVEDHPWGQSALKVRGKAFLFASLPEGRVHFSMKLPVSHPFALAFPCAEPTSHGLGRSGWVTLKIAAPDELDPELIESWLRESYRAVAPKRLSARL